MAKKVIKLEDIRKSRDAEGFDPSIFCGRGMAGFENLLSNIAGKPIKLVEIKSADPPEKQRNIVEFPQKGDDLNDRR